jgi:formylglycine-generating enzyme required for sulfatase activity
MPRLCSSLLLSLLIASSASAVSMAWTPIGNPGNACDPQPQGQGCFGNVAYSYGIGTYEVTNAQYVEFLNAKASADPLGLYNSSMSTGSGGITRTGSSGSYSYSAIAGRANMPVNFVSFYDALRFANWMNNGQGNGNTETGSYTLLGGTAAPSNGGTVTRNATASIVLTSENEWFKAAYHDGSGLSAFDYFDYPTASNTSTTCSAPSATANRANCANAVANLTIVGSYTGSASAYGTFDQGGNVFEWNDLIYDGSPDGSARVVRGGSYAHAQFGVAASNRSIGTATDEGASTGFRLAYIPEPGTGLLVFAGLLGIAVRRRGRA